MNDELKDYLMHYGMPRRSGRYPWGSGEDPYQHNGDFVSRVDELRRQNFTYTDKDGKLYSGDLAIAKSMGLTSTEFRAQLSLANNERRSLEAARARSLREDGLSLREIAKEMGYENDSSVRALLNDNTEQRRQKAKVTAEYLKEIVDEKGMLDVGAGVERELGISREKLNQALKILEEEGYPIYGGGMPQATNPGKQTNLKVLCPPGTEHKDIYNYDKLNTVKDYDKILTEDGEAVRPAFVYPESLNSNRLQVRYAEEGGINKDGLIEVRRGAEDLYLGDGTHYAQVRIMVDGTHYLKGMAVYNDNMPDGVDVIFNTNKKLGTSKMDTLKKIKDDPDNPFGSLIKEHGGQSYYDDPNGNYIDPVTGKKQSLSLINKRAEEGDWKDWSDHLPSQFLSKQNYDLAKKQLYLAETDKQSEYDTICSLTNPTVKKVLLKSFSDDCDSAAVHLQAAALPRQKYQVIMPLESIKDTEVYAPNYKDGERVALVRFPHGSISEIPILKVNNKNAEGLKVLGNSPKDAIGINSKNAERLSGADFDGDTVMVIPVNSRIKITNKPQLEGLKGFDPKTTYAGEVKVDKNGKEHYINKFGKEYKIMKNTQTEMGIVSNLITDMTLKGANDNEIAAAIRHSMVVIDAEKHKLDYKQSYVDNNIAALKKKYQGHIGEDGKYHEGASTLISKAKSEQDVLKRKGTPKIDPKTGNYIYKEVEEHYVDKTGKDKVRVQKSTKMAEAKDARTLISDANTRMENLYADYANKMKSLANQARKETLITKSIPYNPQANRTYKNEVESLDRKLNIALLNAPRERQAQALANSVVKAKKLDYPDMTKAEIKKESQRALAKARTQVGAKRHPIEITDKEWEAIQAGAISDSKLTKILNNTDIDKVKERAMPRQSKQLSQVKIDRIAAMKNSGYTNSEIAEVLGVSSSTITKYLNG